MRSALCSLLLCALAALAAASGPDAREAELASIRGEISRLERKLDAAKKREADLESSLERIKVEIELQEIQLSEATTAHELATARAEAAERRITELEASLVSLRRDLEERLSGLYRLGRQGYLRLFLSLKADRALLPAIRQLRFLVRSDQQLMERYTRSRDQLAAQRQQLEAQRADMAAWRQRESERRDQLVSLRRQRERLLERVARERRQLAARSDALQDKERKLKALIDSFVGRGRPLDGTPMQNFRGVLDWPVSGEVVSGFGPRLDPRYRTEVPHNGIDIEPRPGEAVRAVFPGEVLYASRFDGYGLMVVLHHPGRVFSLYAGLGELKVEKGDVVSLSQELGTVTEKIYFEIRRENQPEDPLGWLR